MRFLRPLRHHLLGLGRHRVNHPKAVGHLRDVQPILLQRRLADRTHHLEEIGRLVADLSFLLVYPSHRAAHRAEVHQPQVPHGILVRRMHEVDQVLSHGVDRLQDRYGELEAAEEGVVVNVGLPAVQEFLRHLEANGDLYALGDHVSELLEVHDLCVCGVDFCEERAKHRALLEHKRLDGEELLLLDLQSGDLLRFVRDDTEVEVAEDVEACRGGGSPRQALVAEEHVSSLVLRSPGIVGGGEDSDRLLAPERPRHPVDHLLVRADDQLEAMALQEAVGHVGAEEASGAAVFVGHHARFLHRVAPQGGGDRL
mmetsp:Transcript_21326/g.53146  ORF Transcript_21326/g.53146 Transcript_21326/m.53146 type:complete len:312 (-) Transcript_21326:834-1769(-)